MPTKIREAQAEQRAETAEFMGLKLALSAEEPEFAADLRAIWPALPENWQHAETYLADTVMGDPSVKMVQVWLCGETGELLMQLTIADDETPLLHLRLLETTGVRLYPAGSSGLTTTDHDRALEAINRLHFRHHLPAPGVH